MNNSIVLPKQIQKNIYTIRGIEVMLDSEIAAIYEVETKVFNQAVKRNIERFPLDFRFQLTQDEFDSLRSQSVTSNENTQRGGRRYLPYVFTEQGIYMLSAILNSPKAIETTIAIMRTFTKLRQYAMEHKDLSLQMHAFKQELKQELTQEITKTKSWTKDRLNAVADSIIILEESITELQEVFTDFKSVNEVEKIGFTRDN